MAKRLLIIIMAFFILSASGVLVFFLLLGETRHDPTTVAEAARMHLERRYGGAFEFVSYFDGGRSAPYVEPDVVQMLFRRTGRADDILVVTWIPVENRVCETDEDTLKSLRALGFEDNYLAVKFRDEMAALIRQIAGEVFGEAIVMYEVARYVKVPHPPPGIGPVIERPIIEQRTLSPDLPARATFERYSTDPRSRIRATIGVLWGKFTCERIDEFERRFQRTGIESKFRFFPMIDAERLSAMAALYDDFTFDLLLPDEFPVAQREISIAYDGQTWGAFLTVMPPMDWPLWVTVIPSWGWEQWEQD